ncbi:MAG TPA: ABC transporter substrate-binding protein [Alphaproteobacteria bacterium]|nr:ABC transporter substrate-binding protein [Alphaproteobacteria bacterium]
MNTVVRPWRAGAQKSTQRGRRRTACSDAITLMVAVAVTVAAIGLPSAAYAGAGPAAEKPTGELRLAMAGIGVMRPIPWQETPFSKGYLTLLYDFLVGTNADGSLSTANGVAERWEVSPDGMTWTFWLRKGVTFHDGTDLTAEDVKWSLEMVTKPESIAAFAARLRNAIKEIEVAEPHKLIIRTNKPDLWLAQDLSMAAGYEGAVLPKKYYEQVGADGFAAKPIGSGPYKWAKGLAGSFIHLEAVDKHWAEGVPKYQTITYRVVPEESTRIAMIQTGEADIVSVSRERVGELQARGLNVFVKERGSVIGCYFHQQWEGHPVGDRRVRQALNLAINRDEIVNFIFAGQAKLMAMYPIGSFAVAAGADPELKPYPYDPAKAKQLLAEAGYPNGFETTIYSYAREDVPELTRLVEAIAGYAAKVGVKLTIFSTEYPVARTRRITGKMPGHISCLGTPNRSSPGDLLTLMHTLHHSSSRLTDHKVPELDALIEAAQTATSEAEAKKLIGDLHRWLYNDYATMPIAEASIPFVANPKKITAWDLGRTLYDNNDRDLIRR